MIEVKVPLGVGPDVAPGAVPRGWPVGGPRPVPGGVCVGGLGDPGTVLLSGPGAASGPETWAGHQTRWGPLPPLDGAQVLSVARAAGLDGRGGGGFPLARKLETALATGGRPLLFVNASESEPSSAKDAALCRWRPHLVLDGAALVATALGTTEVSVHLHDGAGPPVDGMRWAMGDRHRAGHRVDWTLALGPGGYVSGEASAVAGFALDGDARPRFSMVPLATEGPSGRPTVVVNAETAAQLGVLARLGPADWAGLGAGGSPGPRLLTLTGAVDRPGQVVELTGPGTVGDVLARAGGLQAPPAAVLVGGFAGTWVRGEEAWQAPWERSALACVGAGPGCGLLGVLPHGSCGLVETARVVAYLAGESAGQCGTCVAGLPRLAAALASLADGTLRRRALRRVDVLADELLGSGACAHPDGVVRLVRSALSAFDDDVVRHLAGDPCHGADHPPVFAVPAPGRRAGIAVRRVDVAAAS